MTGGLSYFLKEKTPIDSYITISPLGNNILCALLTVVYIKITMDTASFLRERLGFNADMSRKFVHICAGCWLLFWPLFDVTHWSWRLNILVPSVMSVKLFYKVCDDEYFYFFCSVWFRMVPRTVIYLTTSILFVLLQLISLEQNKYSNQH